MLTLTKCGEETRAESGESLRPFFVQLYKRRNVSETKDALRNPMLISYDG